MQIYEGLRIRRFYLLLWWKLGEVWCILLWLVDWDVIVTTSSIFIFMEKKISKHISPIPTLYAYSIMDSFELNLCFPLVINFLSLETNRRYWLITTSFLAHFVYFQLYAIVWPTMYRSQVLKNSAPTRTSFDLLQINWSHYYSST